MVTMGHYPTCYESPPTQLSRIICLLMADTVYEQSLNFYSRRTRGNTNNPIVSLYHEIGYNMPELRLEFRKSPEKQESLVPEEKQQEPSLYFNTYEDLLKLEIKTVRKDTRLLTRSVSPNRHSPSPDDNPLNKSQQNAVHQMESNQYGQQNGAYQNAQHNYNEQMVGFIDKSGQGAELEPQAIYLGGDAEVSAIPIRPDTLMQPEEEVNYQVEEMNKIQNESPVEQPFPQKFDQETQTEPQVEEVKAPQIPYEPIEPPNTSQLGANDIPIVEQPAPEPKKIPFRMAKKEEKKKRKKLKDQEERKVDEMLGIAQSEQPSPVATSQIKAHESKFTIEPVTYQGPHHEPITSPKAQTKPKSPINSQSIPIGTVLQKKSFPKNILKKSPIRKLGNSQATTDSEQRPEEQKLTSDEKKKLLSSFFSMNNE